MKSIFFGSSSYVISIIKVLKSNFGLSLVVTTEKEGEVLDYCKMNSIPYLPISSFDKTTNNKLFAINASVGILADFGLVISDEIIEFFPKGILNIHPSLLPKFRGPTPVQTAILNGDKTTGVSLIKLDNKIDHGPILAQKEEPILKTDTSETLYKRLFEIGAKLLKENLKKYVDNKIKPAEQNDAKASMTKKLTRNDGYIDLPKIKSKEEFEKMVRAYYPWPGVWAKLRLSAKTEDRECRAKQDPAQREKILKFLPNHKLQVEGKKPMTYKDFENGYPHAKEIIKYFYY
ncbi:MAG: methionyl-tRNA formyltransferase [Patescibacteria group bacterium]|nr:methionyl-tRNA formyltransferase [Patescibacteria group bacterium]